MCPPQAKKKMRRETRTVFSSELSASACLLQIYVKSLRGAAARAGRQWQHHLQCAMVQLWSSCMNNATHLRRHGMRRHSAPLRIACCTPSSNPPARRNTTGSPWLQGEGRTQARETCEAGQSTRRRRFVPPADFASRFMGRRPMPYNTFIGGGTHLDQRETCVRCQTSCFTSHGRAPVPLLGSRPRAWRRVAARKQGRGDGQREFILVLLARSNKRIR